MKKDEKIKFVCPRCGERLALIEDEFHYEEGYLINSKTGEINKTKYRTKTDKEFYTNEYIQCVRCKLTAYEGCENKYQEEIDELADKIFKNKK